MDPDACFARWENADTLEEARAAWSDLMTWIKRGGFEPQWTPFRREQFMTWNNGKR
jgi:hypothetical protein